MGAAVREAIRRRIVDNFVVHTERETCPAGDDGCGERGAIGYRPPSSAPIVAMPTVSVMPHRGAHRSVLIGVVRNQCDGHRPIADGAFA